MVPSLLIMVREGFEAGLIVALVFAYLRKIGRLDMARATWLGVSAAFAMSAAVVRSAGGKWRAAVFVIALRTSG